MQIDEIYRIYKNCNGVSIDNRKIENGCLFIAIRGERFDGNAFAASALEEGAAYALIDNEKYKIDNRTILVEDTLQTFQQLANLHRRSFSIPFIAICGSNGKTTTKELTHAVLNTTYKTFSTKGNLNNHIGVPLTILSIPADTEMAIIEIGANHLEETYDLCKIAEPDYGVVTNNGKDHLEGFGSIENVILANSELYTWLRESNGTAFVNANLDDLVKNSEGLKRFTYGFGLVNDISFKVLPGDFASIEIGESQYVVSSKLFGSFNADNLATATAIATHFKVPAERIKTAINNYTPGMNRSQILEKDDVRYIIDCYNANPSSMALALESFSRLPHKPKAVILADMLELGEHSWNEHSRIIDQLRSFSFEKIVLVGNMFGETKGDLDCEHFETTAHAIDWFKHHNFKGWSILLKGSRGYALEKLINS